MTKAMTIMSSQKYRDDDIIEEKIEELTAANATSVEIPVVNAYMKDLDDNDLYIVVDHHHTLSAAIALGIEINFVEVEDEATYYEDLENQNGEAVCESHYMDSPWYYIDLDEDYGIGADVW